MTEPRSPSQAEMNSPENIAEQSRASITSETDRETAIARVLFQLSGRSIAEWHDFPGAQAYFITQAQAIIAADPWTQRATADASVSANIQQENTKLRAEVERLRGICVCALGTLTDEGEEKDRARDYLLQALADTGGGSEIAPSKPLPVCSEVGGISIQELK